MSRGIPVPVINSPTLAKTLKKVRPQLENYKQQLDNLTADIREVENFVRSAGIAQEYRYIVANWKYNPEVVLGQTPGPHGAFWDKLSWLKHEDSKTFKLVHSLCSENDFTCEEEIIFSKPLLESSVNTRKRLFPYLSKFLEELSAAVAVKDAPSKGFAENLLESEEEIPF